VVGQSVADEHLDAELSGALDEGVVAVSLDDEDLLAVGAQLLDDAEADGPGAADDDVAATGLGHGLYPARVVVAPAHVAQRQLHDTFSEQKHAEDGLNILHGLPDGVGGQSADVLHEQERVGVEEGVGPARREATDRRAIGAMQRRADEEDHAEAHHRPHEHAQAAHVEAHDGEAAP
jgi:hypothetical protein